MLLSKKEMKGRSMKFENAKRTGNRLISRFSIHCILLVILLWSSQVIYSYGSLLVVAGPNVSWTNNDGSKLDETLSNRYWYNGGIGVEVQEFLGLILGVNVETRGDNSKFTLGRYDYNTKIKMLYVQIPLLASIYLDPDGVFNRKGFI